MKEIKQKNVSLRWPQNQGEDIVFPILGGLSMQKVVASWFSFWRNGYEHCKLCQLYFSLHQKGSVECRLFIIYCINYLFLLCQYFGFTSCVRIEWFQFSSIFTIFPPPHTRTHLFSAQRNVVQWFLGVGSPTKVPNFFPQF